jgi:hypothetical protein
MLHNSWLLNLMIPDFLNSENKSVPIVVHFIGCKQASSSMMLKSSSVPLMYKWLAVWHVCTAIRYYQKEIELS